MFRSLRIVVCEHEGEDGDDEKDPEEGASTSARNLLIVAIAGLCDGTSHYRSHELAASGGEE